MIKYRETPSLHNSQAASRTPLTSSAQGLPCRPSQVRPWLHFSWHEGSLTS